jgi:Bacterial regulatory proteins, luxR family
LALRRRREADLSASRAEAGAASLQLKLATALAGRARAAVTLAAGDPADAIHAPVEAGRARILAGRALAVTGERPRAAAELQRAAAALDACGAVRHRDDAERALRRLGGRYTGGRAAAGPPPSPAASWRSPTSSGPAGPTRDRGRAVLGEKTVETHLRHIFGKLGVRSRASVARALEGGRAPER